MYIHEMSLFTKHVREICVDKDFGTCGYVCFMVWCGVRIDPFQVTSEAAAQATRRQLLRETELECWEWRGITEEGSESSSTCWTQGKYDQQLESNLIRLCHPGKRKAWLAEQKKRCEERKLLLQAQCDRRDALTKAACAIYATNARPENLASSQIIAHLTYLCLAGMVTGGDKHVPHDKFQLKHISYLFHRGLLCALGMTCKLSWLRVMSKLQK